MTIGSIGGSAGASAFTPLELEGSFTSVAGQLAVLMLDNEETQKQVDRENLAFARATYAEALAEEVEALHEQADATRLGAIVTGTIGMASAGLDIAASVAGAETTSGATSEATAASSGEDCKPILWEKPAADGLGKLAQPLGTYVSHNYGSADAKSAEGARAQASWEIDNLRKDIKDSDATQDKALDWVSGLLGQEAAVTTAILSNKA